jgi:hypothetical protein
VSGNWDRGNDEELVDKKYGLERRLGKGGGIRGGWGKDRGKHPCLYSIWHSDRFRK